MVSYIIKIPRLIDFEQLITYMLIYKNKSCTKSIENIPGNEGNVSVMVWY